MLLSAARYQFKKERIKTMSLLHRGKTKDAYGHGDHMTELEFTDRIT
jgi:phosphoribosylaminoimidazole-succinocarboxamide synthase